MSPMGIQTVFKGISDINQSLSCSYLSHMHTFLGPVYTIPDCIGAERFSYRIRLLFTLRHSNPIRDAEQKSLRFGGDMKSNPVCAEAV